MVEGADGSGKTTLISNLEAYLKNKGLKCIVVKAIGSGVLGENIRNFWLTPLKKEVQLPAEVFSMISAVCDSFYTAEKLIHEGYHVIMDRGFLSTYAYQLYYNKHKTKVDLYNFLEKTLVDTVKNVLLQPDIVIYCNITPLAAEANIATRANLNAMDRMDQGIIMDGIHAGMKLLLDKPTIVYHIDTGPPYPRTYEEHFYTIYDRHLRWKG